MLSFEEYMEIGRKVREEAEKRNEQQKKWHDDYLKSIGVNHNEQKHEKPKYDSVYSLENGEATILWLIVAIAAPIFNGGWIVSIIATVVWFNYITRHNEDK